MQKFWETKYSSSTGLANYTSMAPSLKKTENKFFQWQNKKKEDPKLRDELDQYIADPLVCLEDLEGRTVLDWWLESKQRTRFPLLSEMAIDIYSIPAMSAEAECLFSTTKHIVSLQRKGLKSETIELLLCLKSWFRLGIFPEEDLHAIVATLDEDVKAVEEAMDAVETAETVKATEA